MAAAYAIRSLLGEMHTKIQEEPIVEQSLLVDDTLSVIHDSCREVSTKNLPKYVGKKKVTPHAVSET